MSLGKDVTVKVIQRSGDGAGARRWANTHEIDAGLLPWVFTDAVQVMNAFAAFHQALLLQQYTVERVVLSSYAEDGEPYNPQSFAVREYNEPGLRAQGGSGQPPLDANLPLEVVLKVKRLVGFGRQGTLFLRGYLSEFDITSTTTGEVRLASPPAVSTQVSSAYAALMSALPAGVQLCMTRSVPGVIPTLERRYITGLEVQGLGSKKLNNKYFRRQRPGLIGDIFGVIDAVAENAPALQAIAEAINLLPNVPDVPLLP